MEIVDFTHIYRLLKEMLPLLNKRKANVLSLQINSSLI